MRITPIYHGSILPHAVTFTENIAGRGITDYLMKMVTERNGREINRDLIRIFKEKYGFVSPDFSQETQQGQDELFKYRLPDGNILTLGQTELYECTEIMFDPSLIGLSGINLAESVYSAIMKCDMHHIRRDLAAGLVLSGGSSKFPGFAGKLHDELKNRLFQSSLQAKKIVNSEREYLPWCGDALLANLSIFHSEICVTKQEYNESGPAIIHGRKEFPGSLKYPPPEPAIDNFPQEESKPNLPFSSDPSSVPNASDQGSPEKNSESNDRVIDGNEAQKEKEQQLDSESRKARVDVRSGWGAKGEHDELDYIVRSIRMRLEDYLGPVFRTSRRLKEAFTSRDGNNRIDRREFKDAMVALKVDLKSREIDLIFEKLARDTIDYREFMDLIEAENEGRKKKKQQQSDDKYLKEALAQGKKEWRRSKIMIVGEGRAGKTALANSILGRVYENLDSTIGINEFTCSIGYANVGHEKNDKAWQEVKDQKQSKELELALASMMFDTKTGKANKGGGKKGSVDVDEMAKKVKGGYEEGGSTINGTVMNSEQSHTQERTAENVSVPRGKGLNAARNLSQEEDSQLSSSTKALKTEVMNEKKDKSGSVDNPAAQGSEDIDTSLVMKYLGEQSRLDSKFIISVFDFGGQSVFNVIHPFFLTRIGVYVIVFNMEWLSGYCIDEGELYSVHVILVEFGDHPYSE